MAARRGALAAAVLDFEGAATGQAEALGRFGRRRTARAGWSIGGVWGGHVLGPSKGLTHGSGSFRPVQHLPFA